MVGTSIDDDAGTDVPSFRRVSTTVDSNCTWKMCVRKRWGCTAVICAVVIYLFGFRIRDSANTPRQRLEDSTPKRAAVRNIRSQTCVNRGYEILTRRART